MKGNHNQRRAQEVADALISAAFALERVLPGHVSLSVDPGDRRGEVVLKLEGAPLSFVMAVDMVLFRRSQVHWG